jgi:hypothetical protein
MRIDDPPIRLADYRDLTDVALRRVLNRRAVSTSPSRRR